MIYDTIIVGAGPAGTYAGNLLAKAGLKVALIDYKHFPRDKLCGGLLTCKTIDLLQSILPLENIPKFDITSSHVFYQGQLSASFQLLSTGYTVRRLQFDTLLVEIAKRQGVHVYFGVSLQSINFADKEIYLSDGKKLKYSVLIGADGVLSRVRKIAGLQKNEMGFCLETHVPWTSLKNIDRLVVGGIEIYYGDLHHGYGWIFPCKDSVAIGVGNLTKGISQRNILAKYNRFLDETLSSGSEKITITGAYLPSGTSVALGTPQYEELFLIGDAAGLIDPFTGEGIYYALASAKIAAESIISDSPICSNYKQRMKPITDMVRDTVYIRDRIYSSATIKHLIDFMQSYLLYSERLIDETILRYTKTYADTYEEIKFYNR